MTADSDDVADSADERPEGALRKRGERQAPARTDHATGPAQAEQNEEDDLPA